MKKGTLLTAGILVIVSVLALCNVVLATTQTDAKNAAFLRTTEIAESVIDSMGAVYSNGADVSIVLMPRAFVDRIEDMMEAQLGSVDLPFDPADLQGAKIKLTAQPSGEMRLEITELDGETHVWIKGA